jgi:integrase
MIRNNGRVSSGVGLSPSSVRIVRNLLKTVFNFAVDDGLLAENPVAKTKIPAVSESSASSLTVEETISFVSLKDHYWYGLAFVFQLHTGLRPQELMALIWDDVDFVNGALRIERACKWVKGTCKQIGRTKTKRSNRVIGLEPEHLALLRLHFERQQEVIEGRKKINADYGDRLISKWIRKERPRLAHMYTNTNLIFPSPDGRVPGIDTPRKAFKAMAWRAGIITDKRNVRWYDLRHTHASILLTLGAPPHEVAMRMGHTIGMLYRSYTHMLNNRLRVTSRMFTDFIPT